MSANLPTPSPVVNPETKPFWDATLQEVLLVRFCDQCQEHYWYPRTICPFCGATTTRWVRATGRGRIYTFAITRRSSGEFRDHTPYVLAYVELEEGPRLMTNIIGGSPESLEIGMTVEVVFDNANEGASIPRFRRAL